MSRFAWELGDLEKITRLNEAGTAEDDHFYGAWSRGGGRAGPGSASAVASLSKRAQQFKQDEIDGRSIEGHEWGIKAYADWRKSLTPKEMEALNAWVSSEGPYRQILSAGRGDYDPAYDPKGVVPGYVESLDAVLNRTPIPNDIVAWRGAEAHAVPGGKMTIGKIVKFPSYTSTTLSENVAKNFVRMARESKFRNPRPPVMVKMLIPKGTHGAYITARKDQTVGMSEQEILLARGLTGKIIEDTMGEVRKYRTRLVTIEIQP